MHLCFFTFELLSFWMLNFSCEHNALNIFGESLDMPQVYFTDTSDSLDKFEHGVN